MLEVAAQLALNPIPAILDLLRQGKSDEAQRQLLLLENQWGQYVHYQRRLADHRMDAYRELNDKIAELIGFMLRGGLWDEKGVQVDDIMNKTLDLIILAFKHRPLYEWNLIEEFDQLRARVYSETKGASGKRAWNAEEFLLQLKSLQDRLALEAKVSHHFQEIAEVPNANRKHSA